MFKLEVCSFVSHKLSKCFEELFKLNMSLHGRSMRYSNDVHPPLIKETCRQSIIHTRYKQWNEIPINIRDSRNITCFRKKLKKNT